MKPVFVKGAITALAIFASSFAAQAEDWVPSGPIKMLIAFRAGGGADTLGRILAEELNTRHGWEVIPENLTGKGGVTMALALKSEPADGLSVGVTVTEAITYAPQTTKDPLYSLSDFTFLSTITGTQMGLIAKADRGWTTLADVIAAARDGETITVGAMSQRLADGIYVLGKNNDVEFTIVMTGGGKGSLNAVVADDVDIGWAAGVQTASVLAGEITNLASGEVSPLRMQPDAPQIQDFDLPFDFGVKFMIAAPAGLSEEARETWANAIAEILNDPESKLAKFATKIFSGPDVLQGEALDAALQASFENSAELLQASAN